MINLAIVGCGYWGVNHIRVFTELTNCRVVLACDNSEARLRVVRERFPLVRTSADWHEAVANRWVDAVVIATPATMHLEIAEAALRTGKHVLVEKPLSTTVETSEQVLQAAEQSQRILMVGHTFLYNSGIRKMKELMARGDLGTIYYLHSTRTNMGPIRKDVNALWDLASHDVAIFNYLLGHQPSSVSAVGSRALNNGREDVFFVTLNYSDRVIANIHVSWVDPNKVREVVVVGSQRRIVFDDLKSLEPIRIFEKGVAPALEADSFGEYRLLMRDGDIVSPHVESSEPLKNQAIEFLDCMLNGKQPLSDGQSGLDVVRVLSAIDESAARSGAPVDCCAATGKIKHLIAANF